MADSTHEQRADEHASELARFGLSRRAVLAAAGVGGLGAAIGVTGIFGGIAGGPAGAAAPEQVAQNDAAFPDGVISGDPLPDGTVLWTRHVPTDAAATSAQLTCQVMSDDLTTVLSTTSVTVGPDGGWCAHVAVTGLGADAWYRYRFIAPEGASPTGRLRTAPAPGAAVDHLRFAFMSCQQRSSPYVAHEKLLDEDLDFIIHLGDYIYVSDEGTITLDDYRSVYRMFRDDPALRELHRQLPMVAMWDDGEFYNGVDGKGDPARLQAGRTGYIENMPLISSEAGADTIYRSISWGSLAEIPVLDLRQYRDPAIEANDTETPEGAVALDPKRTALGDEQKAWFYDRLDASTATWKLVAASYNVSPLRLADADTPERRAAEPDLVPNAGNYFPNEAFDDYQYERREMLNKIVEDCIENVVFVAGHTHVYIAGTLYPDYDDAASPAASYEFVTGSLTADPPPEGTYKTLTGQSVSRAEAITGLQAVATAGLDINQHLDFLDMVNQGWGLVDVYPDRITVKFRVLDTFAESPAVSTVWEKTIPVGTLPSMCPEPSPPAVPVVQPPSYTG